MSFAEEWPLLIFTLLSQFAIGTFVLLLIIRTIVNDKKSATKLIYPGFKIIVPVTALALIFSLFHLGTPSGAFRSIFNLGSSWLSREIITAGVFFALASLCLVFYKDESKGNGLALITALFGLAAVFSMASIYHSSIMPAWSSVNTYIVFFGTTLVLGSLGAASVIGLNLKGYGLSSEAVGALKIVAMIGIAAVIIPLVYSPVFISGLNGGGEAAQASAKLITGSYLFLTIIRWVLSLAGVLMLFNIINKQLKSAKAIPLSTVLLALALVVVGEFIGRYVFYVTAVSITVG